MTAGSFCPILLSALICHPIVQNYGVGVSCIEYFGFIKMQARNNTIHFRPNPPYSRYFPSRARSLTPLAPRQCRRPRTVFSLKMRRKIKHCAGYPRVL